MTVVPDSAILVRANQKTNGPARAVRDRLRDWSHQMILSPYLLEETEKVLRYEHVRALFRLSDREIEEYIRDLKAVAEIIDPVVSECVVLKDPKDDPVIYTAVAGTADVICTMDRHFYDPGVIEFCRMRNIRIMGDVQLLALLNRETKQ